MTRRTPKERRIPARDVRLGDRIVCADDIAREVDVLSPLGNDRFRFSFTDDRWIEYAPGKKATVLR